MTKKENGSNAFPLKYLSVKSKTCAVRIFELFPKINSIKGTRIAKLKMSNSIPDSKKTAIK